MLLMGLFTAFGFFVFLMKLPAHIRARALGFDLLLDIAATVAMMMAFSGSYSGMSAAIVGGLIFSAALIVTKKLIGYQSAHWDQYAKRYYWIYHRGLLSPQPQTTTTTNGELL